MQLLNVIRLEAVFIIAVFLPLLVQLAVLFLISRLLWTASGRLHGRAVWILLALIGVPVHELSHAAAFIATGAGVRRLVLFAPRGLPEYGGATGVTVPARNPSLVSRLFASVAPLFGCSLAAWGVLWLLLPAVMGGLAGAAPLGSQPLDVGPMFIAYVQGMLDVITLLPWDRWQTYLAVYLTASLGMGAAPSAEDIRLFLPALGILLVLLFPVFALLQLLGDPEQMLTATQQMVGGFTLAVSSALNIAIVFALIALALVIALAPFRRLFR